MLISISSLKGDTCRGWQVVWREMNEIRGKEVSYTTRHAHWYTCGSWTGCESIPVSQRLLQHVEILWLSKCVVVETVPALTNVGHVTQQQCHSCAWVVIFTRPIIGSQTKIKILAGQCSTQFELDGMGNRCSSCAGFQSEKHKIRKEQIITTCVYNSIYNKLSNTFILSSLELIRQKIWTSTTNNLN